MSDSLTQVAQDAIDRLVPSRVVLKLHSGAPGGGMVANLIGDGMPRGFDFEAPDTVVWRIPDAMRDHHFRPVVSVWHPNGMPLWCVAEDRYDVPFPTIKGGETLTLSDISRPLVM